MNDFINAYIPLGPRSYRSLNTRAVLHTRHIIAAQIALESYFPSNSMHILALLYQLKTGFSEFRPLFSHFFFL